MRDKLHKLWLTERLGLTMIVGSMAVIGVTVYMLLNYQVEGHLGSLRQTGSSIARVLADVPFAQLDLSDNDYGIFHVSQTGEKGKKLAYAAVLGTSGEILSAVTSPGVDVSQLAGTQSPGAWSGERQVSISGSGQEVLELFSPVIQGGETLGTVRIGYFMPRLGLSLDQLPFVGSWSLAIFLMTPLFYFAVRREIRPIQTVNAEIASRIKEGEFNSSTLEASGELKEFIENFNSFMDGARSKIETLEQSNTELATSKKLLSYRKYRIESILKAIPEAVLILGEDGSVTFANEKVEELLGVVPSEILHRKPSEWCMHEEALEFLGRFEKSTTSNYYSETARFVSPASLQKQLSIKAYPLYSPMDPETIFGRLIVLRDVTKEALAEEGRSNFVAHVSHELKTPLNTLALYAEALQGDQGQDDAFRVEAHNVIHDEVERLASLVDNLLNITKIEMGNLKIEKHRVRLHDLLRDAFEHLSVSGRANNLDCKIEVPPELSAVAIDKDLMRIALNNLLTNAIKYTPKGGQISLTAEETGEAIEIRVTDNGIGIAPEDQDKIFEKFYRAESDEVRQIGGHGLGLPLAKEIIDLHRGQLSVSSSPGKGSTFLISLWKDSGLLKQAI